jgi:hypothetical protein
LKKKPLLVFAASVLKLRMNNARILLKSYQPIHRGINIIKDFIKRLNNKIDKDDLGC